MERVNLPPEEIGFFEEDKYYYQDEKLLNINNDDFEMEYFYADTKICVVSTYNPSMVFRLYAEHAVEYYS